MTQYDSQQLVSQALTPVDTVRIEQLWPSYFGTNALMDANRPQIISTLFNFFCDNQQQFLERGEIERYGRVSIDFATLRTTIPVGDFPAMLKDEPGLVLSCLAVAAHQAVVTLGFPLTADRVAVRMTNYSPITALKNLKANFVDRFVALRGNVVRISNVRPLVTAMSFQCTKCGNKIDQLFTDGKYQSPSGCDQKGCKGRNFEPNRATATTVDFQRIRLQEILSTDQHDQGRVPRTIDCELTGDLVDCCIPGDVITVSGVVKARKSEAPKGGGRNRSRTVFLLYLDVNAIDNSKESDSGKLDVVQMKATDLQAVNKIAHIDGLFPYLINSLCPSIYGHEIVKAGLLLALVGGSQKNAGDRNKIAVRGDPHVLIVGDPGMGKSQMLRAVCKIAPRGVYVCGNTATSSGLTVTMVREGKGGDSSLEAGALVLGDQGCCCIDEFDKMGQEHNALLEAMEQQSISIAKAGIVCSLAARTSVLAAANPVGGHYNRAKTVSENLKLSSPLLSRFDLIFILLDKPDEERDQMLSEHVIALHSGGPKSARSMTTPRSITRRMDKDEQIASQLSAGAQFRAEGRPLSERLRVSIDDMNQKGGPLPATLLRKYIAYARKYVKPKLSSDAKKVLEDFYLKLRKEHSSADGTPITTRQLESMIRLAEARAKAELRDVVTDTDAIDVVDIMKESLYDVFADQMGHIDARRAGGMSKGKAAKAFFKLLDKQAKVRETAVWTLSEMAKMAKDSGMVPMDEFSAIIESLNREGLLLNKGGNKYQVQSSQY